MKLFFSLNPFWFRAGGVRCMGAQARGYFVLIPFGSGLGGFNIVHEARDGALVLIPFGSGLGGLIASYLDKKEKEGLNPFWFRAGGV